MSTGKCKICGEFLEMTKEHIPPKSALNKGKIKLLDPSETTKLLTRDKLPWEQDDLKYKISQNGMHLQTLCKKCNNLTGRNYGNSYKDFVLSIAHIIQEKKITAGTSVIIEYDKFDHLSVFKQIISMFASLSNITTRHSIVKDFLLNPEANDFPNKDTHIFINIYLDGQDGLFGPIASGTSRGTLLTYQIKRYPLIITMVYDYEKSKHIGYDFGYDITHFHAYKHGGWQPQKFLLKAIESHTFVPTENRTKEQILKSWNYNDED